MKYDWKKGNLLFISDMHQPYHHQDAFRFLKALKRKYKFKKIISVGDLADFHNVSFHDSDPDLLSAGDELKALQKYSKELEKIFPKMVIVESNHGSLPLRKLFAGGLPKSFLRPYNELYGVNSGWQFVDDLTLQHKDESLYVCHGIVKDGIKLVQQRAINVVSGHYHSTFKIDYVSNPRDLLFSLQVGCLIDPKALAFAYSKLDLSRPILGVGITVNGQPQLIPMLLNKKGRWTGKL